MRLVPVEFLKHRNSPFNIYKQSIISGSRINCTDFSFNRGLVKQLVHNWTLTCLLPFTTSNNLMKGKTKKLLFFLLYIYYFTRVYISCFNYSKICVYCIYEYSNLLLTLYYFFIVDSVLLLF